MYSLTQLFKSLKNSLGIILGEFLSCLYNEKCVICDCSKDGKILCKNCLKTVKILPCFAHTVINGVEIYSVSIYDGVLRKLIHKLKFDHKKDVAKILAGFLSEYYNSAEKFKNFHKDFVLIPVPTNKINIKERGYNNVFEVVKEFSELVKIPYAKNILIKIKDTKPQYKLCAKKRKENISGCFDINLKEYKKYKDKKVLIIDDIYTTGATLEVIIQTFKKYGIKDLICITVSKAV